MKTAAIIAEANPLHNGHAHLFRYVKEALGADRLVVLMSGDFVQRGEPAILDKHRRCRMALAAGADLVLALPVLYAVAPAELFARGAVITLNAAGIADCLVFGSETGTLSPLSALADATTGDARGSYQASLQKELRAGQPYPRASARALASVAPPGLEARILHGEAPNDLLGIEYLRSLRETDSALVPATAPRLPASPRVASASSLRALLREAAPGARAVAPFVPEASLGELGEALSRGERFPSPDDLSDMLRFRLLSATREELARTGDFGEELARRAYSRRLYCDTFLSFADSLKVKSFTHARIRRCLLQLLLGIDREARHRALAERRTLLRVLGLRRRARSLLGALADQARSTHVPLLIRGADYHQPANPTDDLLIRLELAAGALYEQLSRPAGRRRWEEEKPMVVI